MGFFASFEIRFRFPFSTAAPADFSLALNVLCSMVYTIPLCIPTAATTYEMGFMVMVMAMVPGRLTNDFRFQLISRFPLQP